MNISIFSKGLILVSIPLLFQLAFIGLIARIQNENNKASQIADHCEHVVNDARIVLLRAQGVEAELCQSLLTNKREPDGATDPAAPAVLSALRQLDERIGSEPNAGESTAQLHRSVDSLLNWSAEVRRAANAGERQRASALAISAEAKRLLIDLRNDVDAIVQGEQGFRATQAELLEQSQSQLNGLLNTGRILCVIVTVALGFIFWRGISRRFNVVKSNIDELAAGRAMSGTLRGKDELAQIDAAFRNLAKQLALALERANLSSQEARDLFNLAPCGYHSVDPQGTIVAMNRTELDWLGYKAEEVVGRMKLPDLLTDQGKRDFDQKLAVLKQRGEISNLEYDLIRKDGTTMPVLLTSKAVTDADGNFVSSRTTLFDNTERKRAETLIRLYADIVNRSPVGLVVWRLEDVAASRSLRLVMSNPEASNSLGIDVKSLEGKSIVEAFPGISELELKTYADVVRTGIRREIGELLYQDERVAPNYWRVQAFPLPDHCVGVTFENINERKRSAEEIRQLNADLDRRVRERTAELADANRDLSAKNQENEMFVYSVSHDLRSPLVNLQGFSIELEKGCQALAALIADPAVPEDLRTRGKTLLEGKMAKSLGFIKSAVMRLSGIIDALLRLSRAGRVEYHMDHIDLNSLLSTIVDASQTTIAEKKATVHVEHLPELIGDRTAIEQVFANLIGNALVYLDPNRPGLIEVGFQCTNSDVGLDAGGVYFVKDNGLGIAEAHRQKIFQVFQRAHPGVGKGEGIGLAIVARIVERHRGRVWVESTVGQGSTFFVWLPNSAGKKELASKEKRVPVLAEV
jgi:PAS domain S-box-containing protein